MHDDDAVVVEEQHMDWEREKLVCEQPDLEAKEPEGYTETDREMNMPLAWMLRGHYSFEQNESLLATKLELQFGRNDPSWHLCDGK